MQTNKHYLFLTLLLMISFGSVNAVLFTPALPDLSRFFAITEHHSQQAMIWFLVGYALGQLIYGPISNRFGRKPALYAGIGLQIVSSLLCALSGVLDDFNVLIIGRFLMAVGSGVGLKMTFTLVNEYYESTVLSQKIAYLMLAFAIAPGISVALGSFLTHTFGWESCFYAGVVYGLILILMVSQLSEMKKARQLDALHLKPLLRGYVKQFTNPTLFKGALLMGSASSIIYVFSTAAPFVGMTLLGMNSTSYGVAMILPSVGLAIGSLFSAKHSEKYGTIHSITLGLSIVVLSSIMMLFTFFMKLPPLFTLFFPMMVGYFGLSLIFPNSSVLAMYQVSDKANGSAVMSFINMGAVVVAVLAMQFMKMSVVMLFMINFVIEFIIFVIIFRLNKAKLHEKSTKIGISTRHLSGS